MKASEPKQIGRTDVNVTRLGFGAGVIGGLFAEVSEDVAVATVRHALRLGINYIDTAPLYGHGKSETRLGVALADVARDSFVLSTKVGRLLVPTQGQAESIWFKNLPPLEPVFDFSYDAVRRSLETSLERLQLAHVDILHIHDPDGAFDEVMSGAYRALHELREQGVVRAISVGCWDANLLTRFAEAGDFDAFLLPGKYTLLDQSALDELLPVCVRKNISVIVGTPYGSGILATGSRPGAKFNYEDADPQMLDRVRKMEAVCAYYEVPLQAAALNSCATLISMDVVKRWQPDASDARVVRVGRITTGVIMVLAMLWSTQGDQFGTIFEAINKIPMTFAPAVTTVFVLGVLWKRGTKQAAMATLYVGSLIGVIYFLLDLPSTGKWFLPPDQLKDFGGIISDPVHGWGIPFMLVGPLIAVLCIAIYVVTSLLTPAMDKAEVAKVCWDHPLSFLKGPVTALSDPRIVSLALLATVAVLYFLLR